MVGPQWLRRFVTRLLIVALVVPTGVAGAGSIPARAATAGLDGVIAVATGGSHSLALRVDGTVWGWGTNSDWELGVSTPDGPSGSWTPVQAKGLDEVVDVATGDDHGIALRADGTVWAWGKNDHGQVGVPKGADCPHHPRPCVQAPTQVAGLSGMKAVAATHDSSFALGADGTVWAWGDNGKGELGLGTTTDGLAPTRVEGLGTVVSLSAASPHVVALQANGAVWAWGGNAALATPEQVTGLDGVAAVGAGLSRNLALTADGAVWAWAEPDNPTPTVVGGLGPMTSVVGDGFLGAAVAPDGRVWIWETGANAGTPKPPAPVDGLSDITAIAMGLDTNLALKADGTVWVWLRYGSPRPVPAPVAEASAP